jgi:Transglutaminase-like superfamily
MKKLMALVGVCLWTQLTLGFNVNPKNWQQGVLYEHSSAQHQYYLYIHPAGSFYWFEDNGAQMEAIKGHWKRNPITATLKFFSDRLNWTKYIAYPLYVQADGLYKMGADRKLFQLASHQSQQFLLPQLEEAMANPAREYFFYSIKEIGKAPMAYDWDQEVAIQKDAFEVIKKLGQAEYAAEQWCNQNYQKQKVQRTQWSKLYPTAYAAGKTLFGQFKTDSAKVRAMCNWMDEHLKYDLAGSRRDNPDNSPEVIYTLRYGLCLDYARLLNVFCESAGIPCMDIAGYPIDTQDGKKHAGRDSYHAWNYVKVDGQWRAVDPTWYNRKMPRAHFLIPLAAYQYEHVPDYNVEKANPFAPQHYGDLSRCPVVKQYNMNVIYLGKDEVIAEAPDSVLKVCLYAKEPVDLYLHIDSLSAPHHMESHTFTIGTALYRRQSQKGMLFQTYHLHKGVNWIALPMVATIAEYTLINDDFEWMVRAYPAAQKSAAFQKLTDYTHPDWCVTQAYALFRDWLDGKEVLMKNISRRQAQHPNWDFMRTAYHNQPMRYTVDKEGGKLIAYFEFTHLTIDGKMPAIRMEVDEKANALSPARLVLRED